MACVQVVQRGRGLLAAATVGNVYLNQAQAGSVNLDTLAAVDGLHCAQLVLAVNRQHMHGTVDLDGDSEVWQEQVNLQARRQHVADVALDADAGKLGGDEFRQIFLSPAALGLAEVFATIAVNHGATPGTEGPPDLCNLRGRSAHMNPAFCADNSAGPSRDERPSAVRAATLHRVTSSTTATLERRLDVVLAAMEGRAASHACERDEVARAQAAKRGVVNQHVHGGHYRIVAPTSALHDASPLDQRVTS